MSKIIVGLDISTSNTGVAVLWGKTPLAVFETPTKKHAQRKKGKQMNDAMEEIEKACTQVLMIIQNHCKDNNIKEPELQIVFEQPAHKCSFGKRGGDGIKYFIGLWLGAMKSIVPLAHHKLIKATTIKGILPTSHQIKAKNYCEANGHDFSDNNSWNRENVKKYTRLFAEHYMPANGMKGSVLNEDCSDALSIAVFGQLDEVKEKEKW